MDGVFSVVVVVVVAFDLGEVEEVGDEVVVEEAVEEE